MFLNAGKHCWCAYAEFTAKTPFSLSIVHCHFILQFNFGLWFIPKAWRNTFMQFRWTLLLNLKWSGMQFTEIALPRQLKINLTVHMQWKQHVKVQWHCFWRSLHTYYRINSVCDNYVLLWFKRYYKYDHIHLLYLFRKEIWIGGLQWPFSLWKTGKLWNRVNFYPLKNDWNAFQSLKICSHGM